MKRALIPLLLAAILTAACSKSPNSNGKTEADKSLDRVTDAIGIWEKASSFRAKIVVTGLATGATETSLEAVMPDKFHITTDRSEMILIGQTTYLKLPDGRWSKITTGLDNTFGTMKKMMEDLKGSKEIKRIGSETVDGVPTEVYESKMTLPAALGSTVGAGPDSYLVTLWVGASDGLPRKLENTSPTSPMRTTVAYTDYGAAIALEPPIE